MSTLIAYATKYGGTKVLAERIAEKIYGQTDFYDIAGKASVDLSQYDTIVVGCPIYMGKAGKQITRFCERNLAALQSARLGLFLCCIQDLDKAVAQQFSVAFPKPLRDHASVLGALGGVVDYTKLSRFDGFIMNLVAGDLRKKSGADIVSTISQERIDRFVELLQKA